MAEEKKSVGLGDSIAKITNATGIDKMAEGVAKAMGRKDCGCKKRQEKLNQMFPYNNGLEPTQGEDAPKGDTPQH